MNTLEQVKAIIGDKVGFAADTIMDDAWLGPRDPDLSLGRQFLSLDSLDRLELAQELESHFDVTIEDEQIDKPEMGTPAGLAAYIDSRKRAPIPFIETAGDTPVESAAPKTLNPEDWAEHFTVLHNVTPLAKAPTVETLKVWLTDMFGKAIQAGYDAARPLDPGTIYLGEAALAPPISKDELLRRGVDESLDGSVMQIFHALGFDGSEATHALVEIENFGRPEHETDGDMLARLGADAVKWADEFCRINGGLISGDVMVGWFANAIAAGEHATRLRYDPVLRQMYRDAGIADKLPAAGEGIIDGSGIDDVRFRKRPVEIEAVEFVKIDHTAGPIPRIVFNHEQLPEWLIDAIGVADEQPGSVYARDGVLFVGTLEGVHQATPGDWIIRG
jgi:acyl carrier protein